MQTSTVLAGGGSAWVFWHRRAMVGFSAVAIVFRSALAAAAENGSESSPDFGFGWPLLKILGALLIVLFLAYFGLRFGLKRLAAPRAAGRRVQIVERLPLSTSRALLLIEVGGRRLLLGETEGGISTLAELDPAADPPAAAGHLTGGRPRFLDLLRSRRPPDSDQDRPDTLTGPGRNG